MSKAVAVPSLLSHWLSGFPFFLSRFFFFFSLSFFLSFFLFFFFFPGDVSFMDVKGAAQRSQ